MAAPRTWRSVVGGWVAHLTGERQKADPDIGRRLLQEGQAAALARWKRAPAMLLLASERQHRRPPHLAPALTVSPAAATASPFTVTRRLSRSGRLPTATVDPEEDRNGSVAGHLDVVDAELAGSLGRRAGAGRRPERPETTAVRSRGRLLIGALRLWRRRRGRRARSARPDARGSGAGARSPQVAEALPFSS